MSPFVILQAPWQLATSSPMMNTLSLRASSSSRALFKASRTVILCEKLRVRMLVMPFIIYRLYPDNSKIWRNHENSNNSPPAPPAYYFQLKIRAISRTGVKWEQSQRLLNIDYNRYWMDYLGYNIYFAAQEEHSQDDQPEIQQYLSVEDFMDHPEMPILDDSPFQEDDKKLEPTHDITEEPQKPQEGKGKSEPPVAGVVFHQKIIDRYKEVWRGSKNDTVELNINFKTLLVHYFKELRMLNELNPHELAHLKEFIERVPSLNSLMLFFSRSDENQGIRARSLEFFTSRQCLRRIMTSRSSMRTKLQMIKFIEKMRFNILTTGKGRKWKEHTKKQQ